MVLETKFRPYVNFFHDIFNDDETKFSCSREFVRDVISHMKFMSSVFGEVVINYLEEGHDVHFIMHGEVTLGDPKSEHGIVKLGPASYFCDWMYFL